MRAEVISTGTELMRGRSLDTNFAWLADELLRRGHETVHHTTVGDDLEALVPALRAACGRAELVLLTGGLGPTEDDRTREAAALAFGRDLVFHPRLERTIRSRFRHHRVPMARINRRQAFLPRGATPLPNGEGTAPGFLLEHQGTIFAALPGVPREMKPMFRDSILPRLPAGEKIAIAELRVLGMPEGSVDELVARLLRKERRVTYGLTVSGGTVSISLRADGAGGKGTLRRVSGILRRRLGRFFLGEGRITPAEAVAALLEKQRVSLAVAESCTGGLIASRLTDVPGVSAVLREALVTYSNDSKCRRLGVPEALIRRFGAVSAPVARAMAEGSARSSGAEAAVASTGIAGPSGGSRKKPVGLVFLAVRLRGRTVVRRFLFPGDRVQVKERATTAALDLLRRRLMERVQ